MPDILVDCRFEKSAFISTQGKSYYFVVDKRGVYLPKSITTVTEHDGVVDVAIPKWLASKNSLQDYVIAEY